MSLHSWMAPFTWYVLFFSLIPFLMPQIDEPGFVRGQVFLFSDCQHSSLAWSRHSCSTKMLQVNFFFTCNITFLHFMQWPELPLATKPIILSPYLFVLMFTQHGIVVDGDWMRLIRGCRLWVGPSSLHQLPGPQSHVSQESEFPNCLMPD